MIRSWWRLGTATLLHYGSRSCFRYRGSNGRPTIWLRMYWSLWRLSFLTHLLTQNRWKLPRSRVWSCPVRSHTFGCFSSSNTWEPIWKSINVRISNSAILSQFQSDHIDSLDNPRRRVGQQQRRNATTNRIRPRCVHMDESADITIRLLMITLLSWQIRGYAGVSTQSLCTII
jgi:hypothetical protein